MKKDERIAKKASLIFTKLFALIMIILFVATLFFGFCKAGFEFQDENMGSITLKDLNGATYTLMLASLILSTISIAPFLISLIFGHLMKKRDEYLWKITTFIFVIGVILAISGEGYFALTTKQFTEIFNQASFIALIILTSTFGVAAIAMETSVILLFVSDRKESKKKKIIKNKVSEKEIGTKQLNPKFRLFLLIFSNWLIILYLISWLIAFVSIPYLSEHFYIFVIAIVAFIPFIIFYRYWIMSTGTVYFPKDLQEYYVKKNESQLQKIKNLDINHVTQEFNVIPICNEVYSKKQRFDSRTEEEFIKLSWIEESQNRLVVNGKIEDLDFSWGIVTKVKKHSLKVFLLSILYLGPLAGIVIGLIGPSFVNVKFADQNWLSWTTKCHHKTGCLDLFPNHAGKLNSENYLIFSAKTRNQNDLLVLIPKNEIPQPLEFQNQYSWPPNFSNSQKQALENLIKELKFLPSIYLYNDRISIVMKKYHYNAQDNQELQTWELLKDPDTKSEIQFNYLTQAIKIYQIFNQREELNENEN